MSPVLPEVGGETANRDPHRVDTAAAASTTVDGDVSGNLSTEVREAENKGQVPYHRITHPDLNACHRERIVAAGSTARVLLPAAQTEDTDDDDEEDREEQEENNDFLVDFPDETPVCSIHILHPPCSTMTSIRIVYSTFVV